MYVFVCSVLRCTSVGFAVGSWVVLRCAALDVRRRSTIVGSVYKNGRQPCLGSMEQRFLLAVTPSMPWTPSATALVAVLCTLLLSVASAQLNVEQYRERFRQLPAPDVTIPVPFVLHEDAGTQAKVGNVLFVHADRSGAGPVLKQFVKFPYRPSKPKDVFSPAYFRSVWMPRFGGANNRTAEFSMSAVRQELRERIHSSLFQMINRDDDDQDAAKSSATKAYSKAQLQTYTAFRLTSLPAYGVNVTEFLDAYRDNGFTHMVVIIRNPLRGVIAKLQQVERARLNRTDADDQCQRIAFTDAEAEKVLRFFSDDAAAYADALSYGRLQTMLLSFDRHIYFDPHVALLKMADFLRASPSTLRRIARAAGQQDVSVCRHLSNSVSNLDDVRGVLGGTALERLLMDDHDISMDFHKWLYQMTFAMRKVRDAKQ